MWKLLPVLFFCGCATMCNKSNYPTDSSYCDAAQAQLLKLGCIDDAGRQLGGPNSLGVSYGDRCRTAESNGIPMKPQCISTVTSCAGVDQCLQGN